MKHILFITPFVPGKEEGAGAAYTYELLNEMSKTHYVDLVYFENVNNSPYHPSSDNIRVLRRYIVTKAKKIMGALSLFFLFPLFTARFNYSVVLYLRKLIKENHYDFVYFDFSQTFSYALFINHPHKILMLHDVIAQKYSRMKRVLFRWAKWSERVLLESGDTLFTFSEKDSSLIKSLYGLRSYSTTFFISENVMNAFPSSIGDYYVMFGSWGREENYETLTWVMDNIKALIDENERIIVIGGGNIPSEIKDRMEGIQDIEFKGFIDNPYPIIANAKAEIVPLKKGAGVKVKCIEALACGTPVIGSEIAFEGIPERYKEFMFIAHSPVEYREIMTAIKLSVEERINYKKFFVADYNNKAIIKYINTGSI